MSGRGHSSWRDWWHTDPALYESWHCWTRQFVSSRVCAGPREALARAMLPAGSSERAFPLAADPAGPIWEGHFDLVRHLKHELALAAELGEHYENNCI